MTTKLIDFGVILKLFLQSDNINMTYPCSLKLKDQLSVLFKNSIFPNHLIQDLPRKWEKHGDLIVFSANTFSMEEWNTIEPNTVWEAVARVFKVSRIAKQQRISTDGFRTPKVLMLFGDDPHVTHLDNKIKYVNCQPRYSFDVTKNMFSSGNITEKIRMSKLDCRDEIVVDMFAGIGYFSLPLLVHAKAKHLHACEWNPDAVSAFKINLQQNKVKDRCSVYYGDNREVCPVGVANRILLGLIPSARMSYYAACCALNPCTGGTMHIHCNVTSSKQCMKQQIDVMTSHTQPTCYQSKLSSNAKRNISTSVEDMTGSKQPISDDITDDEPSNAEDITPPNICSKSVTCNRVLKSEWLKWAEETTLEIGDNLKLISSGEHSWNFVIKHIERVKSYAPHIDHLVLDLLCVPDQ